VAAAPAVCRQSALISLRKRTRRASKFPTRRGPPRGLSSQVAARWPRGGGDGGGGGGPGAPRTVRGPGARARAAGGAGGDHVPCGRGAGRPGPLRATERASERARESERATNPARPSPLAEAAGAVDGEGAPPGGPREHASTMRVNEKYSTLPAEDRSVHILNICAIEDLGYLPSEGTVSVAAHLRGAGRTRGVRAAPSTPRGGRPPAHVRRESAAAPPSARAHHAGRTARTPRARSQPEPEPTAGTPGGTLPSRPVAMGVPGAAGVGFGLKGGDPVGRHRRKREAAATLRGSSPGAPPASSPVVLCLGRWVRHGNFQRPVVGLTVEVVRLFFGPLSPPWSRWGRRAPPPAPVLAGSQVTWLGTPIQRSSLVQHGNSQNPVVLTVEVGKVPPLPTLAWSQVTWLGTPVQRSSLLTLPLSLGLDPAGHRDPMRSLT
jgi:hypothetical protein